jgi:hypothetical protein
LSSVDGYFNKAREYAGPGGFNSKCKLGDNQLKTAVFAMCHKRWGKNWPLHVRVINWTDDPKQQRTVPFDFIEMHIELAQLHDATPDLCICFLETSSHTMVLVSDGCTCVALDGLNHPALQKLARTAEFAIRKMGFPETPIEYPSLWDQMDDWSCGWHVLNFLEFLLLGTSSIADLRDYLFSC